MGALPGVMRAVMVVGRALGLLLVVLLTMPRAQADCGEREYFHQGLCCVFCEAGTFVAEHCTALHLKGKCDPCEEGKGFTAHENGLEGCLPCRQCKEGQITLRPCTLTQNTECQCKQGYFCADEGCEMCQRISQMHLDGTEIVSNSTDTVDQGLPNQGTGALHWVIPLLVFGLVLLVVALFLKKLKCDKAASTHEDPEGGLVGEPSQIIVKDLSQSELRETFDVFVKEVPPQQWKQLMKTLLQEDDIDEIISKFPDNRGEQSYQMLLIWRNRLGKKQCVVNLLDALRHIDTEAYYSISSTLKSNNILSEVEGED